MTTSEFNTTVDLYADNLYRFLLKNIKDEEKSHDLVQDTFEKMWMRVEEINFTTAKSYMFSTGYRTMIDLIRRDKKQVVMETLPKVKDASFSQYSDVQELLHKALETIPENQRAVILLRDYEGYSYQEIGEITGLSESQVKVYIYRGRKLLARYIGNPEILL